jgi:hypothetical protein
LERGDCGVFIIFLIWIYNCVARVETFKFSSLYCAYPVIDTTCYGHVGPMFVVVDLETYRRKYTSRTMAYIRKRRVVKELSWRKLGLKPANYGNHRAEFALDQCGHWESKEGSVWARYCQVKLNVEIDCDPKHDSGPRTQTEEISRIQCYSNSKQSALCRFRQL